MSYSIPEFQMLTPEQLEVALGYHDHTNNPIPQYRFSGYHIVDQTWNDAHKQAYILGYGFDPEDLSAYINSYCMNFHDREILIDFHFKYLKRILTKSSAPLAPKKPKLTFTQYKYGMLTLSGCTTDGMEEKDKFSDEQGIKYLEGLYQKYFSPQAPKRDFTCNVWIEKEKNNNLHMHVFYRRKKGYLKINTGFLQYSKKGLRKLPSGKKAFNNSTSCYEDEHILNAVGYSYDDENSKVIKELLKEISHADLK